LKKEIVLRGQKISKDTSQRGDERTDKPDGRNVEKKRGGQLKTNDWFKRMSKPKTAKEGRKKSKVKHLEEDHCGVTVLGTLDGGQMSQVVDYKKGDSRQSKKGEEAMRGAWGG